MLWVSSVYKRKIALQLPYDNYLQVYPESHSLIAGVSLFLVTMIVFCYFLPLYYPSCSALTRLDHVDNIMAGMIM
jgi:hypothetical protein